MMPYRRPRTQLLAVALVVLFVLALNRALMEVW